jgi:spore coat polysaccharide biosynthesis protein SpsF
MDLMSNNYLVILQARMSSTRLPGKVLAEINEIPMIYWQVKRIEKSKLIGGICVAISEDPIDDVLFNFLVSHNIEVVRGSLDNVTNRFMKVINSHSQENLIRITGDCPLVMPNLIDEMIEKFNEQNIDYMSNSIMPTFPDGLDVEIFTKKAFTKLLEFQLSPQEIEHVTLGFYQRRGEFRISNFMDNLDRSNFRWTVDYPEDLAFVRNVYSHFKGRETSFEYEDVLEFLSANPQITSEVSASRRNEALLKPTEGHN